LLRKEIAYLKHQLAVATSNRLDDNDGGPDFPVAHFLDEDFMSSYDCKSNADASGTLHNQTAAKSSHQAETATDSLAAAATFSQAIKATAASTLHNETAAKSSHQAETATDSLAAAATFSQAIEATAASTPPAASAAAAKSQKKMKGSDNSSAGNDASSLVPPAASAAADASVVAKVVISDGKRSSVDPTSEGTRLLQYCLDHADRFKWFSSSSSSSKVLMCVCLSALSPFEYHSITGEMIMESCCVTCVGFASPSLGTFGARLTQTATHCIVGLPPVLDAPGPGSEVENILVHPHPLLSNEVRAVSSKQFWRLATPGKWVPSEIMDWYASFLSVNQQSDVKFFGHEFFSLAIRPHDDEEKFQRKLKGVGIDSCTARNVFPCFFHDHWTLTTFEASTARTPRLCFMDSLDLFEHEITEKFETLFGLTSSFNTKVNLCHLNGGIQSEDPLSECAIFTMQNMEAFMESKPFFKVGEWESAARQRTSTGCKVSRNEYAALLREHSVHYLRLNFPAEIPVSLGPRKLDILPQVKQPPPEVVVVSEDSDDFVRKRKSKQKKSTTQKRIAEQVPQPQQKREEDESKTKMPPPPPAASQAPSNALQNQDKSKSHPLICRTCSVKLGLGHCSACKHHAEYPPPLARNMRHRQPSRKLEEDDDPYALVSSHLHMMRFFDV
jgi:hypothetical protein